MGTTDTRIDIANRALALLSANPITSFEDESLEAYTVNQLYDHVLRSLLTDHYWRFAAKTAQLVEIPGKPVGEVWQRRFALPADYLVARDVAREFSGFGNHSGRWGGSGLGGGGYEIYGNEIRTDYDKVFLDYTYQPGPSFFPPYFTDALVYDIAQALAMPLTEQRTKVELLATLARDKRDRAIIQDVQSRPEKKISVSDFISVRF